MVNVVHSSHTTRPDEAHDTIALVAGQFRRQGLGDLRADRSGKRERRKRVCQDNSCRRHRRLHLRRCIDERIAPAARARTEAAHQLDEVVGGSNRRALLAGRASRDVGLDRSLRLLIEGSQGERRQRLDAGMNAGDRHWSSPSEGTTSFSLFYNLHGAANPVTNPKKVPKNLIRGDRRITGVVATHPAAGEARVDIVCQDSRHFPWAGEPPSTHKAKQIGRRGARVHPIGKRRRRFQLATSAECTRRPPETPCQSGKGESRSCLSLWILCNGSRAYAAVSRPGTTAWPCASPLYAGATTAGPRPRSPTCSASARGRFATGSVSIARKGWTLSAPYTIGAIPAR